MKAVFIAFNQAYNEEIENLIMSLGQRGFTKWEDIGGRGTVDGEPHYGNHAWPTQNHAILTVVDDALASELMRRLRETDEASRSLGLRAWVLPVEEAL